MVHNDKSSVPNLLNIWSVKKKKKDNGDFIRNNNIPCKFNKWGNKSFH